MFSKGGLSFRKKGAAFLVVLGLCASTIVADQTLYVTNSYPIYVGGARQATKVFLIFSDSLQKQSAETAGHYSVTNESQTVTVQSAKMGIDHSTCTLTVTPLVNYQLFSLVTTNIVSAKGDSLLPGSNGAFITGIKVNVGGNITIDFSQVDTVPLVSQIIGFDSLPSTTYISTEQWSKDSGPSSHVYFTNTTTDQGSSARTYTATFMAPGKYVLKYVIGFETCVQTLIGAEVSDSLTITVLANSSVLHASSANKTLKATPHALVNIGTTSTFSGIPVEERNSIRMFDVTGRYAGGADKMRKVPGVYFLKTN
jgi:hypothetical protein